jgi:hypothetical protein
MGRKSRAKKERPEGPGPLQVTVSVAADGAVRLSGPTDSPELCMQILQAGQMALVRHAMKEPEPERRVKTLDEVGVRGGRRLP